MFNTSVSSIAEAEVDLMDIDDPIQDESFPVFPSARTMNPFSLHKSDFDDIRCFCYFLPPQDHVDFNICSLNKPSENPSKE